MANTFGVTPDLPQQAAALTGLPPAESLLQDIGELINWQIANLGCDDLISEEWPDGQCQSDGTARWCAQWKIPEISPLHTTYDVEVRADCTTANGNVILEWVEAGLQVVLSPGAVRGELTGSVNAGVAASGYHTVRLRVWGGPTTGVTTVESVRVTPRPLTSPLAEGVLYTVDGDDVTAFGLSGLAADQPLPSERGRAMAATLRALGKRPRMRFSGSGLPNLAAGGANSWTYYPDRRHYGVADWSPAAAGRTSTWDCWAYVKPDAAVATEVVAVLHGGVDDRGRGEGGHAFSTTVAADATETEVWVKLDPAPRPLSPPVRIAGRFGGVVGFNVGNDDGQTTTRLISAAMWGKP